MNERRPEVITLKRSFEQFCLQLGRVFLLPRSRTEKRSETVVASPYAPLKILCVFIKISILNQLVQRIFQRVHRFDFEREVHRLEHDRPVSAINVENLFKSKTISREFDFFLNF